jgi:dienelactone hydrolase
MTADRHRWQPARCVTASAMALLLAACGGGGRAGGDGGVAGDSGIPGAGGESFTLVVDGGFGSGTYLAGATVHVWADVDPLREVVTGWVGDADLLDRPGEWHTTLVMPARNVSLAAPRQARTEVVQVSSSTGSTTTAKTSRYLGGPSPVGLVLLLHGTGGSSNIIEKEEGRAIALAAVARGYAVLAPEAEEVVRGDLDGNGQIRWDPAATPGNVDFANLDALVASLRSRGVIGPLTPVYAVGMSNGGATSIGLGAVSASAVAANFPNLRFSAVVSYCANGRATSAGITTTPTAWFLCANDDNDEVSNDDARVNAATLVSRGVPTVLDEHPASPLYPERFSRVRGVSLDTSRSIVAEFRAAGFVGADGMLTASSATIAAAVQARKSDFPVTTSLTRSQALDLLTQLKAVQAEHTLYSDWAARTVDFLDAHRP